MTTPHAKRPGVSAEALVQTAGNSLPYIREADNVTPSDDKPKHPGVPASLYLAPGYDEDTDTLVELDENGDQRMVDVHAARGDQ